MKTTSKSIIFTAAFMLFVATVGSEARAAIVSSDLIAYWKLDGNLLDSVGTNHGSFSNIGGGNPVPVFATGFDGTSSGAVDFSGTGNFVSTTFTAPTGAKSISFFATETDARFQLLVGVATTQRFYVGARHPDVSNGIIGGLGNGGHHSIPSSNMTPAGTNMTTDDAYHHFVLVDHGAGQATMYYRSPTDSGHLSRDITYTGTPGGLGFFSIGQVDGVTDANQSASGRIDDVAVFNRALTLGEVESIYAAGSVAAAIPEPSSLLLVSLGVFASLLSQTRRVRRSLVA